MASSVKKTTSIFLVISILTAVFAFMMPVVNLTSLDGSNYVAEAASIKDSIKNSKNDLEGAVDEAGSGIVKMAREAGIVITIILIIWIGYSLFFSGNAQSLANMKFRLFALALALIFTFKTETLLKWIFNIIGYDI